MAKYVQEANGAIVVNLLAIITTVHWFVGGGHEFEVCG